MLIRPIELHECTIDVSFEAETDIPPEDSFEEQTDAWRVRQSIMAGDVWAWCCATIKVTWISPSGGEFVGKTYLGGINAEDEKGAREATDGMEADALAALNQEVEKELRSALFTFATRCAVPLPDDMRLYLNCFALNGKEEE
jgi:hypothetical protein